MNKLKFESQANNSSRTEGKVKIEEERVKNKWGTSKEKQPENFFNCLFFCDFGLVGSNYYLTKKKKKNFFNIDFQGKKRRVNK